MLLHMIHNFCKIFGCTIVPMLLPIQKTFAAANNNWIQK